jgi:hypothetical protein
MTIYLPVTMTQNVNTGLNFDQPLFGFRQHNPPWQNKTRNGLHMSAT